MREQTQVTTVRRLRAENADLRKLVQIYEEAIRQLTLTNTDLRERLNSAAKITELPVGRGTKR